MEARTRSWLFEDGLLEPAEFRPVRYRGALEPPDSAAPHLAIFIKSLVVLNTHKWFGAADLRLDAVVIHGGADDGSDVYHPQTFRFPRVADGHDLAAMDNGLMIYLGRPAYFIAFSLILARDTADSDALAALIAKGSSYAELERPLQALGRALPHSAELAAVQAGMSAALKLGDLAYQLVRAVSPRCLGLYRANWLGQRHGFGMGRHPRSGVTSVSDFQLAYQIVNDAPDTVAPNDSP